MHTVMQPPAMQADPFASMSADNNSIPSLNPFSGQAASSESSANASQQGNPFDSFNFSAMSSNVPAAPTNPVQQPTMTMYQTPVNDLQQPAMTMYPTPVTNDLAPTSPVQQPSLTMYPATGNDLPPTSPVQQPVMTMYPTPAQVNDLPALPPSDPPPLPPSEAPPLPPSADSDQFAGILVPSNVPQADPFGVLGSPAPTTDLVPVQKPSDPWSLSIAAPTETKPAMNQNFDPLVGSMNQSPATSADSPQQQQFLELEALVQNDDDDLWGSQREGKEDMLTLPTGIKKSEEQKVFVRGPLSFDGNNLPTGGRHFTANITSNSLGVVFHKALDLSEKFFRDATPDALEAIASRPVVAHVFEGSAAQKAGIVVGTILLSVNGKAVNTTKEARTLIKEANCPFSIDCYDVTNCEHLPITLSERMYMVKYDSPDPTAPKGKHEWKPKYVVVGGVVAQPYHMNMYRSKAEYDKAVRETMRGAQRVSVKVKHFDLVGAKFPHHNADKTWKVQYDIKEWTYLIVVPYQGNPIKIAAVNDEKNLKTVHDGIRHAFALDKRVDTFEEEYRAELRERQTVEPLPPLSSPTNSTCSLPPGTPAWTDADDFKPQEPTF